MTQVRRDLDHLDVPGEHLRRFRALAPDIAARATARIQQQIPAYSGPAAGKRRRLIELAIGAAMAQCIDSLGATVEPPRKVDELFRQMGAGEATDGHSLEPMQAAVHIAIQTIWDSLRRFASEEGLPDGLVCQLGDVLFASTDHLMALTTEGHRGATRLREHSPTLARERLLSGLLRGVDPARLQTLADAATWPLPAAVVVLAVDSRNTGADLRLGDAALVRPRDATTDVVVASDEADATCAVVRKRMPGARIARSWAVSPRDVGSARKWATRALHLVEQGVLPRDPVVRCDEHRTQLWLHAEPALRRGLCQDLLAPLLAETPNSREILSETLLTWLETRDSAPAIAARLGVHPQTVRYRWKRINELFGEDLHEPEFVVQLTLLLKASVPLWKAGDQSDFERFRTQESGE